MLFFINFIFNFCLQIYKYFTVSTHLFETYLISNTNLKLIYSLYPHDLLLIHYCSVYFKNLFSNTKSISIKQTKQHENVINLFNFNSLFNENKIFCF